MFQKDYVPDKTLGNIKPIVEHGMNENHFDQTAVEHSREYSQRINALPPHPRQYNATAEKLKIGRYDSSTLYGDGKLNVNNNH